MRWFKSTVEGAGLSSYGPQVVLAMIFLTSLAAGLMAVSIARVASLGFFVFVGVLALAIEALSSKAKSRRRSLTKLWPEVIDSISSAAEAGLSLIEAFDDLARSGPFRLRKDFAELSARLDSGWSMEESLEALKSRFGEVHSDRLCTLLQVVSVTGSDGLAMILRSQSQTLRRDLEIDAEVKSKQGWINGTAKLAVAAPWLIVAMLSSRPENAQIYNSISGVAILTLGFIISVFAYRLVHVLGALPEQPRVFA